MRDLYMKNGDGFILVYSITDATSLAHTAEIFQSLVRIRQKYHVGFTEFFRLSDASIC